ncbi:hypothetical protein VTO42DRAFT_4668 [Malbranchea cinnamomea]
MRTTKATAQHKGPPGKSVRQRKGKSTVGKNECSGSGLVKGDQYQKTRSREGREKQAEKPGPQKQQLLLACGSTQKSEQQRQGDDGKTEFLPPVVREDVPTAAAVGLDSRAPPHQPQGNTRHSLGNLERVPVQRWKRKVDLEQQPPCDWEVIRTANTPKEGTQVSKNNDGCGDTLERSLGVRFARREALGVPANWVDHGTADSARLIRRAIGQDPPGQRKVPRLVQRGLFDWHLRLENSNFHTTFSVSPASPDWI